MALLFTICLTYLAVGGVFADGPPGLGIFFQETLKQSKDLVDKSFGQSKNILNNGLVVGQTIVDRGIEQSTQILINPINGTTVLMGQIGKEVAAVKQPIDETVTFIGSSQCSNVKKIVGVAYEQMDGGNEPDFNQLSLEYISSSARMSFKLSSAQLFIPNALKSSANQKLILFLHGFIDDPTLFSFKSISDAMLKRGEVNVLGLDSSSLIRWFYLRSSTYVRFIGQKLGETLAAMTKSGLDPANIHIIGHSLGAHISGFAGKTFYELTGQKVGRISGLDPAGPCFSHIDPELRLKETDANFVDVMHTDCGVFGLRQPSGHVDFYPNGGSEQDGCLTQTCSHNRAWAYYAESTSNPDAFLAVKCKDWDHFKKGQCESEFSVMGYDTKPTTRGIYFLQTNGASPYGLGENGAKYRNNEAIVKIVLTTLG